MPLSFCHLLTPQKEIDNDAMEWTVRLTVAASVVFNSIPVKIEWQISRWHHQNLAEVPPHLWLTLTRWLYQRFSTANWMNVIHVFVLTNMNYVCSQLRFETEDQTFVRYC